MSTIMRDRAEQSRNPNEDVLTNMVKFATAERELQRQEWVTALAMNLTKDEVNKLCEAIEAILSAGPKSQNPFGCGCWRIVNGGWEHDTKYGTHTLHHEQVACQWCGAKRRTQ